MPLSYGQFALLWKCTSWNFMISCKISHVSAFHIEGWEVKSNKKYEGVGGQIQQEKCSYLGTLWIFEKTPYLLEWTVENTPYMYLLDGVSSLYLAELPRAGFKFP